MRHLVFYDGACGFCDALVQVLLEVDRKKLFAFAPLQGETAAIYLKGQRPLLEMDTLVLVENYQDGKPVVYMYGQAALRVCWLLGGAWKLLGWPSFMPGFLYDWAYRLIARNRHKILGKRIVCLLPDSKHSDRFLP